MGSYTFMEGGYPGATMAGADAQNHGSTVRRSMQLRRPVAPGIYASRSITTESGELGWSIDVQRCEVWHKRAALHLTPARVEVFGYTEYGLVGSGPVCRTLSTKRLVPNATGTLVQAPFHIFSFMHH